MGISEHEGTLPGEGARAWKRLFGRAIRRRARELGYSERDVLHAEGSFDWNSLLAASSSMSLFAEQRLLELVKNNLALPAPSLREEIVAQIRKFVGNAAQHDDLTMIIVEARQSS